MTDRFSAANLAAFLLTTIQQYPLTMLEYEVFYK